ncbi:unnamed protein product [Vitrella brassicaformis CCMP3155]|uniref:Right handed beta helix domain-containing protein n=1 Tax=Vitrella brassicaformis (strain CCMP3155) TaxID=1169540 RepID=A0A0G4GBK6_VITBC|nr:unnamed protein product [Vitrella brassicaformis CCMP3155]|eukprot:CEM26495.1 unnamed protein product [Vitrella brassicaformis CCMP3155]
MGGRFSLLLLLVLSGFADVALTLSPLPQLDRESSCTRPQITKVSSPEEVACTAAAVLEKLLASKDATADRAWQIMCDEVTILDLSGTPEIEISTQHNTYIDGNGKAVIKGTRLVMNTRVWDEPVPVVTLRGLGLTGSKSSIKQVSGDETKDGGGAFYRYGGTLEVVDCWFWDNAAPEKGQDVGGGAIYSLAGVTKVDRSVFYMNKGSNGGAMGNLHNSLHVTNSWFIDNQATGVEGNPGNGGNGGAISIDGQNKAMYFCNVLFTGNKANSFGGSIFRTDNEWQVKGGDETTIENALFYRNAILPDDNQGFAAGVYLQGSKAIIENSIFANNTADAYTSIFIGPNTRECDIDNVAISGNSCADGLTAGLVVSGSTDGEAKALTIVDNISIGDVCFAVATNGGGAWTLADSVIYRNYAGNVWPSTNCKDVWGEGGGNYHSLTKPSAQGGQDTKCSADASDFSTEGGTIEYVSPLCPQAKVGGSNKGAICSAMPTYELGADGVTLKITEDVRDAMEADLFLTRSSTTRTPDNAGLLLLGSTLLWLTLSQLGL